MASCCSILMSIMSAGTSPGTSPSGSSMYPFFLGPAFLISYLPPRIRRCLINRSPCLPYTYDGVHCCYHVLPLKKLAFATKFFMGLFSLFMNYHEGVVHIRDLFKSIIGQCSIFFLNFIHRKIVQNNFSLLFGFGYAYA